MCINFTLTPFQPPQLISQENQSQWNTLREVLHAKMASKSLKERDEFFLQCALGELGARCRVRCGSRCQQSFLLHDWELLVVNI